MELGQYGSFAQTLATAGDMTATGAKLLPIMVRQVEVVKFGFIVTTTLSVPGVVTLFRRPTPNNSAGQVSLGVITGTTAMNAVGTVVFMDLPVVGTGPVKIPPGTQLHLEVTTAWTTGAAQFFIDYQARPLQKRNTSSGWYTKIGDFAPANG